MNASLSILRAAEEAPREPCVVTRAQVLSFAQVAERVRALLPRFEQHAIRAGDHAPVAFVAQPTLETVTLILALIELGVPAMPLHPRWSSSEQESALARGRGTARAARRFEPMVDPREPKHPLALAEPGAAPDPEDILAVIHSSGSGGAARGVLLSRRAFVASARQSAHNLGWREHDRWLLALPLAHVGGFSIVVRCLLARRAVVLGDPATDLAATHTTLASLVPTQLGRLLDANVACPPALRAVLLGGAASTPTLLEIARRRGYPVLATYGTTETCSQIATQPPSATSLHDVGPPLPGTELRLVGERIEVRSPTLASGFYPDDLPLPLDREGWLALPDRGRLDAEGRLVVLGRADDVIVSGGENVAPLEVEAALAAHPDVAAACVFPEPDADFGQKVCALLVTATGGVPADLRAHLAGRLAGFKWPKAIVLCAALPLLPSGKVDRHAAATLFRRGPSTPLP